MASDQILGMYQ